MACKRWLILLLVFFAPALYAQNIPFSDIVIAADGRPIGGAGVAVCSQGLSTTAANVTSGFATLTMLSNPVTAGFAPGMTITVSGFTGADTYLNAGTVQQGQITGGVTILSVTSTTISFLLNHANASATSNGQVFQEGNQAIPCAPLTTIFYDQPGLNQITQPGFVADAIGNYSFYAPSGFYTIQFYGPGVTVKLKPISLATASGTSLLPLPNVWTATNNFSVGLQVYGVTVSPFTGTATQADCVNVFSVSPLLLGDAGAPCGSGGGGGGTVVASPQFQIFSQPTAGTHATAQGSNLTTDATGNNLNVPGNTALTGTLTVTGNDTENANVAIKGPRPYVDVTAYGADPTNTIDSTTAIQNAINAACTAQSTVFFPPGAYKVAQPQSPSNAPILVPGSGCNNAGHGLYLLGGGSNGTSASFVPQARIFVNNGASPGLGPLIVLGASGQTNGVGSARIENMALQCYNQCVQELSGGDIVLKNNDMTTTAPQTNCSSGGCTTDTTPLALYGGLEFYIDGGAYINDNSPSGSNTSIAASILLSTDSANHSAGLLYLSNTVNFGPVADIALTAPTAGWGTVQENNVIFEALGNASPFVLNNLGSPTTFGGLNLTNVLVADSNPGFPLIYLKGGNFYGGITIVNSSPTTNPPGTVQVADSGFLGNCTGGTAINSSNVSIPGCVSGTQAGLAFVGPTTYTNNVPEYYSTFYPPLNFSGSTIQMTRAGENNTSLEIDPLMGDMFGPGGSVGGYDVSLARSGAQTLGLSLARALPPTAITASAAAGGSLSAGTHVYGVTSAVGASNCNTITNYWLTASMTAGSGNNSALVGWTDPANTASITGYCVLRDPSGTAATQAFFVAGSGSTSYTDTGTGGSLISGPIINNTFPASPQDTFGINGTTLNNLTVTGTCTNCGFPSGLTPGVIPQASASPPLVNSSPLLDNGNTTANTLTYAGTGGIAASKMTDSGLTNGNCMQAGAGGLLTTVGGPCSTGGTVTSVNAAAATLFNWVTITGGPVTTTGTLTFTPTTGETSHQVIGTCGSLTAFQPCALVAADIPTLNQNTTGSAAQWAGVALTGTASNGQCPVASSSSAAAWGSCGSGGGSTFTGMTSNGLAYATSATGGTSVTPPSANGQYACGYLVTAGVTVPPTCPLLGIAGATISGASNSYNLTYADNGTVIVHDVAGSASATATIPTAATLGNTTFSFAYTNHSSHSDTVSATAPEVIQQGTNAAALTITVGSAVYCRFKRDTFNSNTWDADCAPNGGAGSVAFSSVTSGTSTGALLVGTGGSLTVSGSGTINSTAVDGVTITGVPTNGQCPVASSGTAAAWGSCGSSISFPVTVSGTTTTGHFPYFSGATTLSNNANLDDSATVANTLTYVGTSGLTATLGPIQAGISGSGVGQPFIFQEGTAPVGIASKDLCYGDSTLHGIKCSYNNGTFFPNVLGPASSATGNLVTWNNSGGSLTADSGIAASTLVTAAAAATAANQVCTASGASKTCTYIDFPENHPFPAANCFNANPGDGWSSNVAAVCRGGTNNKGGYIPLTDTTTAQFQVDLPLDWDSNTRPYIRFKVSSSDTTAGHTIIPSIQVSCTGVNGGTTDDVTFNAAHSASTITLNSTANQFWGNSNVQMNATDVTGCNAGGLMIIQVSRATDTATSANFYSAVVTIPRLLVVQAN